ncbi:hypothetical protein HPB50_008875 [Hyalomma asiaticum]|uniref:Uncharacterized protein n=1 Tax=Hyalomma asiaticum TaxID=266040 RepID=A0ACB7THN6_HYAAI|nr:hypothetical protein HPB50_008875 [Hyalomma asiaticum]
MSAVATKGGGDASDVLDGLKAHGSGSSSVDSTEPLTLFSLKRKLRKDYGARVMEPLSRYLRAIYDLSAYANKVTFLDQCRIMNVVPVEYRVQCPDINNTRNVVRLLGICSYKLLLADLEYSRTRKEQVAHLLELLYEELAGVLSSEDLHDVLAVSKVKYENVYQATREKQRAMFVELLEEYEINVRKEKDKRHQSARDFEE